MVIAWRINLLMRLGRTVPRRYGWPNSQTLSCRGMSGAFCRGRQACNRQRTAQGVQYAQDVLQAQGGFARL